MSILFYSNLVPHIEWYEGTICSHFITTPLLNIVLSVCTPLLPPPPSRWISVLQNSKEEALNKAFKGVQDEGGENNIVQALTKAIVVEVKRMSGNDCCCDCGAPSE